MNAKLEKFARNSLKSDLAILPKENKRLFKLMYARKMVDGIATRTVEEAVEMDINDVVNEMPCEQLDWAMTQVENTLQNILKGP